MSDTLAYCQWIVHHDNCLTTGPTGAGKTYLARALAHKACRECHSVLYPIFRSSCHFRGRMQLVSARKWRGAIGDWIV